jgi:carboxylesterase type B
MHEGASTPEELLKILDFGTDIGFRAPAVRLAEMWRSAGYMYHFNEPNPWPGVNEGRAVHILDLAFLLLNFEDQLGSEQRHTARSFAEDFVRFANGLELSKPAGDLCTKDDGRSKVYGPKSITDNAAATGAREPHCGFSDRMLDLEQKIGMDNLSMALSNFLAGQ